MIGATAVSQADTPTWPQPLSTYAGEAAACIAIYSESFDQHIVHTLPQCERRLAPCSTFKVPNALIGLEADPDEQGKLVAVHALQVLQGQKVHILPVREAKKISLKINQKTAGQLGLTIPSDIASKAQIVK